jgi:hypothetical protein
MIPRTILITVVMACIPAATASGVECANDDCGNTAQPIHRHDWPQSSICGEDLGNAVCQNNRPKSYYKCQSCNSITSQNQRNSAGTNPPCRHRGKRLFTPPASVQMPGVAASHPPSSEGETPYKMVGHDVKCFQFL